MVSIASIQAVVASLWLRRFYSEFISGFLLVLCGIEALALSHWLLFIPLGLESPFEVIMNINMGVFYLSAYLTPLIIFFFLYMWIIKPLIRWSRRDRTVSLDSSTKFVKDTAFVNSRRYLLFISICCSIFDFVHRFFNF